MAVTGGLLLFEECAQFTNRNDVWNKQKIKTTSFLIIKAKLIDLGVKIERSKISKNRRISTIVFALVSYASRGTINGLTRF